MAKTGTVRKSRQQQARDAELGLIIDELGRAMWSADKAYIAAHALSITPNMSLALAKFHNYCVRYHGEKA